MDATRAEAHDPTRPVDIQCGRQLPIRSSSLAAILEYRYDPHAPHRVKEKLVDFTCLVITTDGRWQLHGADGETEINSSVVRLGVAADAYGCFHHREHPDSNLVVALRAGALDLNYPRLFAGQTVPSQSALRGARNAVRAITDDGFDSVIFTMFGDASDLSTGHAGFAGSKVRMQRAKRFIEFHAFERIGLTEIASELGLSPFTMVRQFREATGITPYSYLLQIRLDRAKQLLARAGTPIGDVAKAVGIDDLAYFSRWFRRSTGLSASSYRESRR